MGENLKYEVVHVTHTDWYAKISDGDRVLARAVFDDRESAVRWLAQKRDAAESDCRDPDCQCRRK